MLYFLVDFVYDLNQFIIKLHINAYFEINLGNHVGKVKYVDICEVDKLNIM